jgi:hypothetical protein
MLAFIKHSTMPSTMPSAKPPTSLHPADWLLDGGSFETQRYSGGSIMNP